MKFEQWNIPAPDDEKTARLMGAGYPYLLSAVLTARGADTAEKAAAALAHERTLTHNPFLMRDMDKAVARIQEALSRGERLAVFGDYDVDGITATSILVDYLRSHGGDVVLHIPGRFDEGYGLSNDAIHSLSERGVRLLVTVDCGITGVQETEYAKSLGMDVIITDHHECKEVLPAAVAVVNPHRPDCDYPFKHLAGVGVALKLVLALGGAEQENTLFARYVTLAAIGTIADVMRMEGENRAIVTLGLESVGHCDFIGLHALLRESGLAGKRLNSTHVGYVISPRINAAGRMGQASLAADLLLTHDGAEAQRLARELCALNQERKEVEQEIFSMASEQLEQLPPEETYAIVLASADWHQGVVGIVASRLSEKYACPCFMIHLADGIGKGSCRSCGGLNLFDALESCADLLVSFGGHELAAGFTIEEANIPAFRRRMNDYVRERTGKTMPLSSLNIDAELTHPSEVSVSEVERLDQLEPYGAGNERPVFCLRGALLETVQGVGQDRHTKVRIKKGRTSFEGIFFSVSPFESGFTAGSRVDAAFYLQVNEFRGSRTVQLQLLDLRFARTPSMHEAGLLALRELLRSGAALSPRDAVRLTPSRGQFVRAWRFLERDAGDGELSEPELPLLRRMAAALGGAESFLRAAICLDVFEERGLLCSRRNGEYLNLRLTSDGKKVELNDSLYLRRLQDVLR